MVVHSTPNSSQNIQSALDSNIEKILHTGQGETFNKPLMKTVKSATFKQKKTLNKKFRRFFDRIGQPLI